MSTNNVKRAGAGRAAKLFITSLLGSAMALAAATQDPVQVEHAWARATVPGQQNTGVFMQLTAATDLRLRAVETPLAELGEIHEMRMVDGVMKMRALADGLPLPAHQRVALQPGGYHVMLMHLKQPLKADRSIALTLVFVDAQGREQRSTLEVPVAAMSYAPPHQDANH